MVVEPALLQAWMVANEPRAAGGSGTSGALSAWMADATKHIKSNAPNQLV